MALSQPDVTPSRPGGPTTRELRALYFWALAAISLQYGLGMWVNLFARLPNKDSASGLFDGFGRAVANGPAVLGIHAVFGVVIGVITLLALIRCVQSHRAILVVLAAIGASSIVGAAVNGASFVGDASSGNGNSFGMAVSAGVGLLAYAWGLLVI